MMFSEANNIQVSFASFDFSIASAEISILCRYKILDLLDANSNNL